MEQILKQQSDHLKKINEVAKQDRLLQIAQLYEARKADKDDDRVVKVVEKLQKESHEAFFGDKEGLNSNIVKLGEILTKQFDQQKLPGLPAKFVRELMDLRQASAIAPPSGADQTLNQTRQLTQLIDEKQLQKLFEVQVLNNIQDNLKQLSKEQSAEVVRDLYAEFKKGITKGIAEELSKATAEQKVAISTLLAREMRQSVGSQAQGEEAPVTRQRKTAGKASRPSEEQQVTPSTRYFKQPGDEEPEKMKNPFTIEGMFDLSEGKSKGLIGDALRRRVARKKEAEARAQAREQYIQDRMTVDPTMINLKPFQGDKEKLTASLGKQFDKQQEITKEYESNQQRITQLREAGYGEDAIKRSGLLKKQGQLIEDLKEVDPRLRQKKQQPGTPEAPTLATPLQVGLPEAAPVVSTEQQNENLRLMTEQNDVLKRIEENTRGLKELASAKPQRDREPTRASPQPQEQTSLLDTVGDALDVASVLGRKGIRSTGRILGRVGRGIGTAATTVATRAGGLFSRGASAVGGLASRGASTVGGLASRGASTVGGLASRGASAVGGLGGVARVLGPAAAVGMGAYDAYSGWQEASAQQARGEITEDQADVAKSAAVGKGVGGASGALAGAAAGAALGSVVPVVGTAIGGLAGGALGYFGGSKVGEAVGEYGSRAWKGVKGWFGKGDETKTPVGSDTPSKPMPNWEATKKGYKIGWTPVSHLNKFYPGIDEKYIELAQKRVPRTDSLMSIEIHEDYLKQLVLDQAGSPRLPDRQPATPATAATPATPATAATPATPATAVGTLVEDEAIDFNTFRENNPAGHQALTQRQIELTKQFKSTLENDKTFNEEMKGKSPARYAAELDRRAKRMAEQQALQEFKPKMNAAGAVTPTATPATPATAVTPETKPSPVDRKASGREDIVKQYAAADTAEKQATQRRKEFEEANRGQASTRQDILGDDETYYKDSALQKQYEQLKRGEYNARTQKRSAGAAYAKTDNVQKTYAFGGEIPRTRQGDEDIRAGLLNEVNKVKALEARGVDISKFETTDNSNYIQFGSKRYSRQILGAYEQVIKKELETEAAKLQTPAQPAAAATPAAPTQVTPPPPQTGDAVYRQSSENAAAAAVAPPAPPVIVNAPQNTTVSQTANYGPKIPARNTESSVQQYNRARFAY